MINCFTKAIALTQTFNLEANINTLVWGHIAEWP